MLITFWKVNTVKTKWKIENLLEQNENETNFRIFRAWYFQTSSGTVSKVIKIKDAISVILVALAYFIIINSPIAFI